MHSRVPEQDGAGKAISVVQLILFLAMFIGIYVFVRQYVQSFFLRVLCLIGDYIVCSLILFLIFKPLSDKAAESLRKRK